MSVVSCTICLGSLDLKDEIIHATSCGHVFHQLCLTQALKTNSSCPHCRRSSVRHAQLFFVAGTDDDEDIAGALNPADPNFVASQFSKITKKLDFITANMNLGESSRTSSDVASGSSPNKNRGEVRMYRDLVDQLRKENQDLREILEMEKILSTNTEKEIDHLKMEVRERNDLINALQLQNDSLLEETQLYERPPRKPKVKVGNLLDLE